MAAWLFASGAPTARSDAGGSAEAAVARSGATPSTLHSEPAPCAPLRFRIQGTSLAPLVRPGALLDADPPGCGPPLARRDVVFVRTAASTTPVAKVIHALPGDAFSLRAAASGGGFRLEVEGEVARNASGQPFTLTPAAAKVLALYAADYAGRIPPAALLVLGERPGGSLDSTRFGLVAVSDVIGRARLPARPPPP